MESRAVVVGMEVGLEPQLFMLMEAFEGPSWCMFWKPVP